MERNGGEPKSGRLGVAGKLIQPTVQHPFSRSSPWPIPGTVEAEDFDEGGEGVSWHSAFKRDTLRDGYRTGVPIDQGQKANGEWVIGFKQSGEWTEYSVSVEEEQELEFTVVTASPNDTASLRLSLAGDLIGDVSAHTGGWSDYQPTSFGTHPVLPGEYILKLESTGEPCNVDKIEVKNVTVADGGYGTENYGGPPAYGDV